MSMAASSLLRGPHTRSVVMEPQWKGVNSELTLDASHSRGVLHRSSSTTNIGDISEPSMMYSCAHHSILNSDAAGPLWWMTVSTLAAELSLRLWTAKFPTVSCLLQVCCLHALCKDNRLNTDRHVLTFLSPAVAAAPKSCWRATTWQQRQRSEVSGTDKAILSIVRLAFQVFNTRSFEVRRLTCLNYSWRQYGVNVCCLCEDRTRGQALHARWIYVFNVELLSNNNISYWSPGHRIKGTSYDLQHGCKPPSAAVKYATAPLASSLFKAAFFNTTDWGNKFKACGGRDNMLKWWKNWAPGRKAGGRERERDASKHEFCH